MTTSRNVYKEGSLTAGAGDRVIPSNFRTGVQALQLDDRKDGFIYVPQGYTPAKPAALALMLHGAGGIAEHGLNLLKPYADERNIILLAPASRLETWDIIARGSFNADVIFIDQALSIVFDTYVVDPAHIIIGGFSDGASYALSLGLSNGQLFTHVIAFSPGFYYTKRSVGKPAVFISHGLNDNVLPINPCSRRIVPDLKRQGYDVNYQEFEGAHEIPGFISAGAMNWSGM